MSDGTAFASFDSNLFGEETPVAENGVVYVPDRMKGWGNDNVAFTALQLPSTVVEKTVIKPLFELNWERDHVQLRGISFWVASPLYVDGIVYAEDMSGGLMAVDVKQQKSVYRRWLDWYARFDRYLYGAVASPTLGGKNIYLVDDAGSTIILKPGPVYQEVARNVIENISPSTQSGNPCRQGGVLQLAGVFRKCDVFEGGGISLCDTDGQIIWFFPAHRVKSGGGIGRGFIHLKTRARMRNPKRWNISGSDSAAAEELASRLKTSPIVAQLLLNRGMHEPRDCQDFLRPSLKCLHDPAGIPGLTRAAERVARAIREKQKIVVYGDYDVDGITATSILWHAIRQLGGSVEFYIPHRLEEGYGLNAEAIEQICKEGARA